jgi:molybdopterin converting factor small subunit
MQFRTAPPPTAQLTIRVTMRLFAQYAELLGIQQLDIELPQGATVADAVSALRRQVPAAAQLPQRPLAARNLTHVLPTQRLTDGDELALLPPLAGG